MDEVGRLNILYQDMRTAKYWLMKAAERGYEPSKKRLKLLKVADTFNRVGSFFGPSGNANVVRVVNNCPSVSEVAPKVLQTKLLLSKIRKATIARRARHSMMQRKTFANGERHSMILRAIIVFWAVLSMIPREITVLGDLRFMMRRETI